jgi:hypothetical protein
VELFNVKVGGAYSYHSAVTDGTAFYNFSFSELYDVTGLLISYS